LAVARRRAAAALLPKSDPFVRRKEHAMPDAVKDYLSPQWWAVAECVDAYEAKCGTEFPDLRKFVAGLPASDRPVAIAELMKIEMERRWNAGVKKQVEDYLREYPELADPSVSLSDLVGHESAVRQRHGHPSSAEELRSRFPNLSASPASPDKADVISTVALSDPNAETKRSDSIPPTRDSSGTLPFDSRVSSAAQSGTGSKPSSSAGPITAASGSQPQQASASDSISAPRIESIGRYQVRDELGSGTFGVVYRCVDAELKRDVAVKVPRASRSNASDRAKEFLHEARSAARLRHAGIVTVLDTGQTSDGRVFVVYEFIRGITLQKRLDRGGYTVEEVVGWIAGAADALHHAHKNGIVHRDIKPANILLDEEQRPHIADFGLAKMDDQFFKDDAGHVLGTVAYMSPEQAAGQSHWAAPQTDIYSLGVVLYQMLTKRLPFSAGSVSQVLEQVQKRVPAPPRTIDDKIPKPLEAICLRAMAKNPADRYSTAADMAAELRAAVQAAPPPRRISRMSIAIGGAAAAALAILLMFAWNRDNSSKALNNTASGGGQNGSQPGSPAGSLPSFSFASGTPQLEIDYQSPQEKGVSHAWHPLDGKPLTIHEGDKLQFHVTLGVPRFVYLFWYDTNGKPTLLWPPNPAKQQAVKRVDSPQGDDLWHGVDSERGAECFLVAVRDEPLDATALEKFEQQLAYDKGDVRLDGVYSLGSAELSRGLAPVVKSKKNPFAPQFEKSLAATFSSHLGAVIPHQ